METLAPRIRESRGPPAEFRNSVQSLEVQQGESEVLPLRGQRSWSPTAAQVLGAFCPNLHRGKAERSAPEFGKENWEYAAPG